MKKLMTHLLVQSLLYSPVSFGFTGLSTTTGSNEISSTFYGLGPIRLDMGEPVSADFNKDGLDFNPDYSLSLMPSLQYTSTYNYNDKDRYKFSFDNMFQTPWSLSHGRFSPLASYWDYGRYDYFSFSSNTSCPVDNQSSGNQFKFMENWTNRICGKDSMGPLFDQASNKNGRVEPVKFCNNLFESVKSGACPAPYYSPGELNSFKESLKMNAKSDIESGGKLFIERSKNQLSEMMNKFTAISGAQSKMMGMPIDLAYYNNFMEDDSSAGAHDQAKSMLQCIPGGFSGIMSQLSDCSSMDDNTKDQILGEFISMCDDNPEKCGLINPKKMVVGENGKAEDLKKIYPWLNSLYATQLTSLAANMGVSVKELASTFDDKMRNVDSGGKKKVNDLMSSLSAFDLELRTKWRTHEEGLKMGVQLITSGDEVWDNLLFVSEDSEKEMAKGNMRPLLQESVSRVSEAFLKNTSPGSEREAIEQALDFSTLSLNGTLAAGAGPKRGIASKSHEASQHSLVQIGESLSEVSCDGGCPIGFGFQGPIQSSGITLAQEAQNNDHLAISQARSLRESYVNHMYDTLRNNNLSPEEANLFTRSHQIVTSSLVSTNLSILTLHNLMKEDKALDPQNPNHKKLLRHLKMKGILGTPRLDDSFEHDFEKLDSLLESARKTMSELNKGNDIQFDSKKMTSEIYQKMIKNGMNNLNKDCAEVQKIPAQICSDYQNKSFDFDKFMAAKQLEDLAAGVDGFGPSQSDDSGRKKAFLSCYRFQTESLNSASACQNLRIMTFGVMTSDLERDVFGASCEERNSSEIALNREVVDSVKDSVLADGEVGQVSFSSGLIGASKNVQNAFNNDRFTSYSTASSGMSANDRVRSVFDSIKSGGDISSRSAAGFGDAMLGGESGKTISKSTDSKGGMWDNLVDFGSKSSSDSSSSESSSSFFDFFGGGNAKKVEVAEDEDSKKEKNSSASAVESEIQKLADNDLLKKLKEMEERQRKTQAALDQFFAKEKEVKKDSAEESKYKAEIENLKKQLADQKIAQESLAKEAKERNLVRDFMNGTGSRSSTSLAGNNSSIPIPTPVAQSDSKGISSGSSSSNLSSGRSFASTGSPNSSASFTGGSDGKGAVNSRRIITDLDGIDGLLTYESKVSVSADVIKNAPFVRDSSQVEKILANSGKKSAVVTMEEGTFIYYYDETGALLRYEAEIDKKTNSPLIVDGQVVFKREAEVNKVNKVKRSIASENSPEVVPQVPQRKVIRVEDLINTLEDGTKF